MYDYSRNRWQWFLLQPLSSLRREVWVQTIATLAVSVGCVVAYRSGWRIATPIAYHEVGGILVALTLGFRANAAYARFWEARTLWGGIVNASRNLHRILTEHANAELGERAGRWVVVFAHATRRWLRDESVEAEANRLLPAGVAAECTSAHHPPLHAARQLSGMIAEATPPLSPFMAQLAERQLCSLVDFLGGAERIRRTPTPLGYVVVVRQIVLAFVITLPLGIIAKAGPLTPIVVLLVSLPVFAIESLAAELDDPFGHDPNHLPLSRITATIEQNLAGVAGKPDPTLS